MKYGKALRILLQSILIAAFLMGIALLSIYLLKSFVRKSVSSGAQNAVKSAISSGGGDVTYDVPDSDFYSVDGELGEDDISPSDLMYQMKTLSSTHTRLKLIGILEIPCIKVKEPIWDSCSKTALRYGVGRFPDSCNIGEAGNCTIFGHRMKNKTIFWQLQKLEKKIGEEVIVTTTDGVKHKYTIVSTTYVKGSAVDPYLTADLFSTEHLCLATCGYGKDPFNKKIFWPKATEFIVICVPIAT